MTPCKRYRIGEFEVWEFEELDSTNTYASRLRPEDKKDKTVILTGWQTGGRGQQHNRWESEAGKNLSLSLVLKPQGVEAASQFAVSMVIALGCRDFIARRTDGCSIKWPNDIYVGEQKIAGILIEHTLSGNRIAESVCGIGININQRRFLSDAPNPVSLAQLTGGETDLQAALAELLECITVRYAGIGDYRELEQEFKAVMYRRMGWYRWRDAARIFDAEIAGLDEFGRLRLREPGGKTGVYGFKEIAYC
ncbi:MAG: biotin--[acetyl-CoA-carboxylase] ligase [Culturomica sp.]|jgi:BirA family biotin operon repressor/biotin-[acetyl-CoA-carboxylase] ligase|nr:biotin--[acetyl-CoA-carboxylase] ligase [Culturomica sp.]